MNISIASHKTNLQGAALIAFGFVSAQLGKDLAVNASRNTWKDTLGYVVQAIGDKDGKDAVEACSSAISEIKTAISAKSTAEALSNAGYGAFHQIVTDEKGNEGAPTRVSAKIRQMFGEKWKFGQALKTALTTLANYESRYIKALQAGVTLEALMTQKDIQEATAKAELEALPEEQREERIAELDNVKTSRNVGADFANLFLTGDEYTLSTIAHTRTCLLGLADADSVLKDAYIEALKGFADKFAEAHAAAQAVKAEAESLTSMDGVDGNVSDSTVVSVATQAREAQAA